MARVVSLLPSATELVCLVLAEQPHHEIQAVLVGRSHECDWPPRGASGGQGDAIAELPALTAAKTTFTTSGDVDAQVGARARGEGQGGWVDWSREGRGGWRGAHATPRHRRSANHLTAPRSAQQPPQVRAALASGAGLYAVDAELLARLAPDLIITQVGARRSIRARARAHGLRLGTLLAAAAPCPSSHPCSLFARCVPWTTAWWRGWRLGCTPAPAC